MTAADLIAFEGRPWRSAGAKERAILDRFGNVTRYYQQLNVALDDQAAISRDPVTAHRLRRLRRSSLRAR